MNNFKEKQHLLEGAWDISAYSAECKGSMYNGKAIKSARDLKGLMIKNKNKMILDRKTVEKQVKGLNKILNDQDRKNGFEYFVAELTLSGEYTGK